MDLLLSDFASGLLAQPRRDQEHLAQLINERQPDAIDFQGWQRIDKQERILGAESGRSRTKIVVLMAMLDAARGEAS